MDTDPWKDYAFLQVTKLQNDLRNTTNCHKANAIDQTLGCLVEKIAAGEQLTDKQVQNMQRDRWRKERKREVILKKIDITEAYDSSSDELIMISDISRVLPKTDFKLVIRKAAGYTNFELSAQFPSLSSAAIKKRIYRSYEKIAHLQGES